jgi:hypothetical protein
MLKSITALAFVASTAAVPVSSQTIQADMRCVETDQAMTQRLRELLAQDRRTIAGTTPLHLVMTRMASARFDCKHGRVERGLQTYADADLALRAIEADAVKPAAAPPTVALTISP